MRPQPPAEVPALKPSDVVEELTGHSGLKVRTEASFGWTGALAGSSPELCPAGGEVRCDSGIRRCVCRCARCGLYSLDDIRSPRIGHFPETLSP